MASHPGRHADPWRWRCPEGHTAWRRLVSGGIKCFSCNQQYPKLFDAKRHTFPTDEY